jgi:mitosis inhibitor protein kinase SWE1
MLAASFRAQAMIGSTTQGGSANKLNRDFVIMQSLGRGEFSQVWKVKEKKTGRMYAVKAGRAYTGTKNR